MKKFTTFALVLETELAIVEFGTLGVGPLTNSN